MSSIISPNMNLIVPSVGSESGPQYAFDINSSLTLIDQHDHSPGKGVLITPSGINIISALNFNGNPASNLSYESFIAGSAPSTIVQSVSVARSSSINELFYTDSNGTSTQITKNGVVNATASSIPGESYDAGTFIWVQGSGSTTPANFDIGSIILRPNTAGTTNGITLLNPGTADYTITFPTNTPSSTTSVLLINSSGVMSTISGAAGTVLTGGSNPSFQNLSAPTQTIFTTGTSLTYTPPTGVIWLKVTAVGGGGGGGGGGSSTPTGQAGGDTLFGSFITAGGGSGGIGGNASIAGWGGTGGSASLTTGSGINGIETNGGDGGGTINSASNNTPGTGGGSIFGTGGRGGTVNSPGGGNGHPGLAIGSGGGGSYNTNGYFGGGCGGAGAACIAYISSVASSYTYTVGAGGSGGSQTNSGGAGASGIIIIEEYYS